MRYRAARNAELRALTVDGNPPAPPLSGARVVDAALFRVLLDLELLKAQRLRYCLCVVCLKGAFASEAQTSWLSLAHLVAHRIRATDIAVAQGRDAAALLLIDADITALPAILRRVITDFESVPWTAGAASYPKSANTVDELLEQASRMLLRADRDGGRRANSEP